VVDAVVGETVQKTGDMLESLIFPDVSVRPAPWAGADPCFWEAYPNGRYCGRRVALLYSAGGVFARRHCFGLVYDCQNETPWLRSFRRARKIRMRLGAGFSFAEPFPDKPPGMHWLTHLRMRVAAGESIAIYDQP
jgi:hypothetical protein